jgi:hypothetical protein
VAKLKKENIMSKHETLSDLTAHLARVTAGVTNPMIEIAAEAWHEAERQAGNGRNPWSNLSEDERTGARKRAELVLDGEVKWSETGPGDRAIWEGRSGSRRAVMRAKVALSRHARRSDGERSDLIWYNWYDTLRIEPGRQHTCPSSVRLFGNANVGNYRDTNLQCAGTLSFGDCAAFVADLYVTCRIDQEPEAAHEMLQAARIMLIVGEKYVTPWTSGAAAALDRCPVDLLIPPRQNVHVIVDLIPSEMSERIKHPLALVVHLDGAVQRDVY